MVTALKKEGVGQRRKNYRRTSGNRGASLDIPEKRLLKQTVGKRKGIIDKERKNKGLKPLAEQQS